MRLKLVPDETRIDFFRLARVTFGASIVAMILSVALWLVMGLNFGIDFRGGTTIRAVSAQPVDVGAYRQALQPLDLGDVLITQVFDPTFGEDENVVSVRVQAQAGEESMPPETIDAIRTALQAVAPDIAFQSVESVGPKVSAELVRSAIVAVAASLVLIMVYIWLRFEWQFAIGAVAALFHDVLLTIGVFALFQIRFDTATIAALLTVIGYSINDTVVIFDRTRENLRKYKQMPLRDLLNLSANETLSRTVMTTGTTLLALAALLIFGGDVIRGFVFAIFFGVIVGTYSSIYMAKNIVLMLGVKRDWSKTDAKAGTKFADIDA